MAEIHKLALQIFPFLGSVKRAVTYYTSPESIPVRFRREDLDSLPVPMDISPLYLQEMSIDNEEDIKEWLHIINQAFVRNLKKDDYFRYIKNHPIYDVRHTYFLMDGKKHIGVVSEASFKLNKEVGVTHYMGLNKEYLGHGLGNYMISYILHQMKAHDIKSCEVESTLHHKESLCIHYNLGFHPLMRIDYWNTPNSAPKIMRFIVYCKCMHLFTKRQKH